jgi:DNA-binding NtrC family response regulator
MSPRILLYGLPAELSRELRDVLITTHHVPDIEDEEEIRTGSVSWPEVDLVFCSAERNSLANLLQATLQYRPRLRIIATSRLPETAEWLDSVEAGATDYCAAPFEATQIRWLLDTHLSKQKPVAA